jgi:hypothetical protein
MDKDSASKQPPLDYATPPPKPSRRSWVSRLLPTSPIPLGMIYLIMFILSIVAAVLAVVIASIVHALR